MTNFKAGVGRVFELVVPFVAVDERNGIFSFVDAITLGCALAGGGFDVFVAGL